MKSWKVATEGEAFAPPSDFPGLSSAPKSLEDATAIIWHDPTRYDPFTHGPSYFKEAMSPVMSRKASGELGSEVFSITSEAPEVVLPAVLSVLQALAQLHRTHHWLTYGGSFYGDHKLFEELYTATVAEVDAVAERAVGSGAPLNLMAPSVQGVKVGQILSVMSQGEAYGERESPESYVQTSLRVEQWFLTAMRAIATTLEASGNLSRGTDNLLAAIEDQHEKHVYLLSQRTKSWKAE